MAASTAHLTVVEHPLVAAKLTVLRRKDTKTADFRSALQELSVLLLAEASRGWARASVAIETPLTATEGVTLARPVALVPILRAGLGMLDGMLRLLPDASVGHLGLYRDEKTLRPVSYYRRLPRNIAECEVLLLDPMLATGHSACEAVTILKSHGVVAPKFISVVACPAGIAQLQQAHPNVPIYTAAVDPELNAIGYIVPGLGDAGDRYFGT
ncbi:MAG: uracil phosphoribosyltransferase [Chthoniobacterales bacterium]